MKKAEQKVKRDGPYYTLDNPASEMHERIVICHKAVRTLWPAMADRDELTVVATAAPVKGSMKFKLICYPNGSFDELNSRFGQNKYAPQAIAFLLDEYGFDLNKPFYVSIK